MVVLDQGRVTDTEATNSSCRPETSTRNCSRCGHALSNNSLIAFPATARDGGDPCRFRTRQGSPYARAGLKSRCRGAGAKAGLPSVDEGALLFANTVHLEPSVECRQRSVTPAGHQVSVTGAELTRDRSAGVQIRLRQTGDQGVRLRRRYGRLSVRDE